jgi:glycosyltransferase involved in cell wall biosynthesis
MAKQIHFFATFHTLGGVENMLAHHHRLDRNHGLDSVVVSAFKKGSTGGKGPLCLGLTGLSTLRDLRREFAALIEKHRPETLIYHNLWGCHSLCDLDHAKRRIGFIHTDSAPMRATLAREMDSLDGVIAVSPAIAEFAASVWKHGDASRIRQIDYPVAPPDGLPPLRPALHTPFLLGYCGRLLIEQKRVDRLPAAWRQLRACLPDARLEILGEGVERKKLEVLWQSEKDIRFNGRQSGGDYWRILANWDAILFTSDYEGTPISLLEAMSVGVLPVYPETGSGGDDYVKKLSPSLLYRHGDPDSLPAVFRWLGSRSGEEIAALRQRARELVAAHSLENYFRQYTSHLAAFSAAPPVANPAPPEIPWLASRIPFRILSRKSAAILV